MQAADSVSRPNGKVGVSTLNKEVFFLKSQFNNKKTSKLFIKRGGI